MRATEDITGQRFGKWTALRFSKRLDNGAIYWWCKCDCGSEQEVYKYNLIKNSRQCKKCATAPEDLTGKRFGRLIAIRYRADKESGFWECKCDCGAIVFKSSSCLRKGVSCRCRNCTWEDLTGMRFGSQTVIKRLYQEKAWLVRCDCGEEVIKKSQTVKMTFTCGRCETKKFLNMRFGKLIVKELTYNKGQCVAFAQCDCGNWWKGSPHSLSRGGTKSCGCAVRDKHMNEAKEMIGKKNGYLTIIKIMGYVNGTYRILFQARCICGKKKLIPREDLPYVQSCGCALQRNKLRGEDAPHSLLKNIDAAAIREFHRSNIGYTVPQLASMFEVKESVIYNVLSEKSYKEYVEK